jgi:hypothetical protein
LVDGGEIADAGRISEGAGLGLSDLGGCDEEDEAAQPICDKLNRSISAITTVLENVTQEIIDRTRRQTRARTEERFIEVAPG